MSASWPHPPELEQKLVMLAEFEAEIKDHPSNAVSFATNAFLDTLAALVHEQDVSTKKTVVHAFTSVFPHAFKTICQNEGETRMWQTIVALKSHTFPLLAQHPNQGVKVAVAKLMQVVVTVQSKREAGVSGTSKPEISLALVHPTHRVLRVTELEDESRTTLNSLLAILKLEGVASTTITAIINSLAPLLRARPQYTRIVLQALAGWSKPLSSGLPPLQVKMVEKTIKTVLTSLVRMEQLSTYRPDILRTLAGVGGNVATFQPRHPRPPGKDGGNGGGNAAKRTLATSPTVGETAGAGKRARLEDTGGPSSLPSSSSYTAVAPAPVPTPANLNMGVFAGFDFTTLPLQIVVELCVATLTNISNEQLTLAIVNARQAVPQLQPQPALAPSGPPQPKRDPRLRRDPRLQHTLPPSQSLPTSAPTLALPPAPIPAHVPAPVPALAPMPAPAPAPAPAPISTSVPASTTPAINSLSTQEARLAYPDIVQVQTLPAQVQAQQPPPQSQLPYPELKPDPDINLPTETDLNLSAAAAAVERPSGSRSPLYQPQQQPPTSPMPSLQERATQSFRIQPFTLKPPTQLTPDQCKATMHLAFRRILEAEEAISAGATAGGIVSIDSGVGFGATPSSPTTARRLGPVTLTRASWMLILTRLITRGIPSGDADAEEPQPELDSDDTKPAETPALYADEMRELLLQFILADYRDRSELAVHWLYDEWHQDQRALRAASSLPGSEYEPRYFRWLLRLLDGLLPLLDARDRTLARLLLDVPELSDEAVEVTRRYMEVPERVATGIETLQELITARPPVREACLGVLLGCCVHEDTKIRSKAILTVRRWVPDHAEISPRVERFALETLNTLCDENPPSEPWPASPAPPAPTDDEDAAVPDAPSRREWTEQEVSRRIELFLALCGKRVDMLSELFSVHAKATEFVQRVIRQRIKGLIKAIGQQSSKLLNIIRNFPPGGDRLVIRILVVLTDTVRPSPELVKVVKAVYVERDLDAKFLIPIISGLTKDEIKQYLPRIVALLDGTPQQNQVVKTVFSRITTGAGNTSPPISSQDLLMALHDMEGIPLKKVVEAINVCFNMQETFKSEIIAVVLQQLIDQSKIPGLSMMTMIRSVQVYKNLTGFVMSLLSKLIQRKVWNDPKLWDGFIKCCERTQPQSFKILVNLPRQQLKDVITRVPAMEKPVREFAEKAKQTRVLQVLDEVATA